MKITEKTIKCRDIENYENSNRIRDFNIAIFTFDYDGDDRKFLDKVIQKGTILAQRVNPAAANNASHKRKKERLINNATAGLLAEYCWKQYINSKSGKTIVDYTKFDGASSQIDLVTINKGKLIEVRSSFPRNGIEFAICHEEFQFDILGPYSNLVKPGEIQKDFYTRTLFHIPNGTTFLQLLKKASFNVYLTGGATWEMMIDDKFSINKNLLPEDAVSVNEDEQSAYRVVPFDKALDTIEIFELIREL